MENTETYYGEDYTNEKDLLITNDPDMNISLSSNKKLIGKVLTGISYEVDPGCNETALCFGFEDGTEIYIYKCDETGKVEFETD